MPWFADEEAGIERYRGIAVVLAVEAGVVYMDNLVEHASAVDLVAACLHFPAMPKGLDFEPDFVVRRVDVESGEFAEFVA